MSKLQAFRSPTLLKKIQHRSFPMNNAKICKKHMWWSSFRLTLQNSLFVLILRCLFQLPWLHLFESKSSGLVSMLYCSSLQSFFFFTLTFNLTVIFTRQWKVLIIEVFTENILNGKLHFHAVDFLIFSQTKVT